jgi:hypothetical protein
LLGTRSSTAPETSPHVPCLVLSSCFSLRSSAGDPFLRKTQGKHGMGNWHSVTSGSESDLHFPSEWMRGLGAVVVQLHKDTSTEHKRLPWSSNTKGHHPGYPVLDINLNPLFPILAFQRAAQANSIPNTSQTPIFCHEYIRPLFALALALLPWYVVRRNGCSVSG